MSVAIVKITNPFEPSSKQREEVPYTGKPLLSYVEELNGEKHVVSVSGEIVPAEKWDAIIPVSGQEITIRPQVGKGFFRIFAMIALVAAAIIIPYAIPALTTAGAAFSGSLTVWGMVVSAAISMVGGLLINAFLPPPTPALGNTKDTPSYSFQGAQLTARQGSVIQRGYGTFRVSGNIIGSRVISYASQQTMYLLIDMGFGPAASISKIEINENDASNYKGISIWKRLGYMDQNVIPVFNHLINDYSQNTLITGTGFIVNGHRDDTEEIEVEVVFPKGLYYYDDKGNMQPETVQWKVEYKLSTDSTWTSLVSPRTLTTVSSSAKWVALSEDQFEGQVIAYATSNSDNHYEGESYYSNQNFDYYDDADALLGNYSKPTKGYWAENPAYSGSTNGQGATPSTPGTWTTISKTVKRASENPTRDSITFKTPTKGKYDVRVTRVSAVDSRVNSADEMWLSSVKEISYDSLTYPGQILLGIAAIATDQLSGSAVNVTAEVTYAIDSVGYKNVIAGDRPLAFYRLNETSGTVCVDSSGRGFDAVYADSANTTFQKSSLIKKSPAKSTLFHGAGGMINYTSGFNLGTNFTIECVIKLTGGSSSNQIAVVTGGAIQFKVPNPDTDGRLNCYYSGADHFSATALKTGFIYHVVFRVENGNLTFIINGVKDANTYSSVPSFTANSFLYNFYGYAQAIAVYNYALRPGKIRYHYLASVSKLNILEDIRHNNPAMVAADILVNPWYSTGNSHDVVDEIAFKKLADRCDEVLPDGFGGVTYRHSFDGVFDTQSNLWDALGKIGTSCRAIFMRTGTKYTVAPDMPSNVVQVFNMGNIIKGSFKESWLSSVDRGNSVDLFFMDERNRFKRQPITVELDEDISAGADVKKGPSVEMFGVTEEGRIVREGKYMLYGNKYQIRMAEWACWMDALHSLPGDVVALAHDVSNWGISGRVASATNASIVFLDQKVKQEIGQSYTLLVRLDKVSRATGTISAIDDDIITLSGYSGDTTVKRIVTANADLKVIGWGASYVQVERNYYDVYRVTTTGGTNFIKCYFDAGTSKKDQVYYVAARVVNLKAENLTLESTLGASQIIPANKEAWVTLTVTGDGTTANRLNFKSAVSGGGSVDMLVWDVIIRETHQNTNLVNSDFSGLTGASGATFANNTPQKVPNQASDLIATGDAYTAYDTDVISVKTVAVPSIGTLGIGTMNYCAKSEPKVSDLVTASNVRDAYLDDDTTNVIYFPSGALLSNAYVQPVYTTGIFSASFFVQMEDNSSPRVSATQTNSFDFALQFNNTAYGSSTVSRYANTPDGKIVYRVSVNAINIGSVSGTNPTFGIIRYAAQSGKAFKVWGLQLEKVGVASTDYVKTTGNQAFLTDRVALSTPLDGTPNQYDLFVFNSISTVYKKFRLLNVSRTKDLKFKLTGIEYRSEIYSDIDPNIANPSNGYSVYGPVRSDSASNDTAAGTVAWTNPTNIIAEDAVYANVTGSSVTSNYLKAITFNPRVLSKDTIVGIQFIVKRKAVGVVNTSTVQVYKGGSWQTVTVSDSAWSATDEYHSFGGSTNLLGLSNWLPTDLNDSKFGIRFNCTLGTSATAYVDSVKVIVYVSRGDDAAVTNLSAVVDLRTSPPTVNVNWKNGIATDTVDIYCKLNSDSEVFIGTSGKKANTYSFQAGQRGDTAVIRAVGTNPNNFAAPYQTAPTTSLALGAQPANVVNFRATAWSSPNVTLQWNANSEGTLDHYEIRYAATFEGATWENATSVSTPGSGATSANLTNGAGTYLIKAFLTDKTRSDTAMKVMVGMTLLGIDDDAGRKARTALHSNAAPTSYPLDSTTIDATHSNVVVHPFTMRAGVDIPCLSGDYTISNLTPNQKYTIYYLDQYFQGGSITPQATQSDAVLKQSPYTFIIGDIITPPYISGPSLEYLRPSTYDNNGETTPVTPTYAYDSNDTTYAQVKNAWDSGLAVGLYGNTVWRSIPSRSISAPSSIELHIINSAAGATSTPVWIYYSTNGGTSWTPLTAYGAGGLTTSRAKTEDVVTLSTSQDTSLVRVRAYATDPADQFHSASVNIYEIFVKVTA